MAETGPRRLIYYLRVTEDVPRFTEDVYYMQSLESIDRNHWQVVWRRSIFIFLDFSVFCLLFILHTFVLQSLFQKSLLFKS